MTRTQRILAVLAATTATATPAFADDPKFVYSAPPDAKDAKVVDPGAALWTAAAEGGLVLTTGNADTTSLSAGLHLSRKQGNNKLSLDAAGVYASSTTHVLNDKNGNGLIDNNGEITNTSTVTAETLGAKARYDRYLTTSNSLYAAALAGRDLPAGNTAVLGAQAGYSRQLYKTKTTEAVAELGYDYSHESHVDDSRLSIHSARGFVGIKSTVSDGVATEASLEALTNLNHETLVTGADGSAFMDTRLHGHVAVTAKLGKALAIQTAFDVRYDNRPNALDVKPLAPGFVPEAEKLDTLLKASFIYTF